MTLTLPELEQKIRQLAEEQSQLVLPDLDQIAKEILYHSARTHSVDPKTAADHKERLELALSAEQQGKINWQRNAKINTELRQLRSEYDTQLADQKREAAQAATKRLEEAHQEFHHAARQLVRAYRRAMQVANQNGKIKGASTQLPPPFDIQMKGFSQNTEFRTSDQMAMGLLPIERKEMEGNSPDGAQPQRAAA